MDTLHYVSGGTAEQVSKVGFNLIDIQYYEQLESLPEGTKALLWLNEGSGVTRSFKAKLEPFLGGHPKLFGFSLFDEPDPTGRWNTKVTAADLKAESDYIHANVPGAKTFIATMNMGSLTNPSYKNTYNPENTNIDLFGINPYPFRTETPTDYGTIDRAVAAAVEAGIPKSAIVPIYQTFGGGNWKTDTGDNYRMPSTSELQTKLDQWQVVVPSPVFDYVYHWSSQQGDTSLDDSLALQNVMRTHNNGASTHAEDRPEAAIAEQSVLYAEGASQEPTGKEASGGGKSGSNGADSFRFNGSKLDGHRTKVLSDVDFREDKLVFIHFDKGTFDDVSGGNRLQNSNDGTYVRVKTMVDLKELVTASNDVRADVGGGDVAISVTQDSGTQHVVLEGLGSAYSDVDAILF
jgi:hypothetical protein